MKPMEILRLLVESKSCGKEDANSLLEKMIPFLDGYSIKKYFFEGYSSIYASLGNNLRPKILFLGHLDTVDAKGWKNSDPFRLETNGTRAYGLGIYDMKAGVAAMIHLAKIFPKENLGYLFVTDEEMGGFSGAAKLAEKINPEFVIALEPTGLAIELAAKGVLNIKIISRGLSAHSSMPEKGANAIEKLSEYIAEIKKLPFLNQKNRLLGSSTMSQTIIKCPNERENQIPDYCETLVNIRYIPEQDKEKITKLLVKKAKQFSKKGLEIAVEPSQICGYPVQTDKNNIYAKLLASAIKSELGKVGYVGNAGASDARFFAERKIPVTCFGPAGGEMHAPHEWLDLKKYEKYIKILEKFVKSI